MPLSITVSPASPNGLRVQGLIRSPGGIKVTDKEAKKVFCRDFQKVGRLRQPTNAATPAAPVPLPASGATTPKTEKPLANADIVALTVAGLSASVLVSTIQQAPSEQFDVSTDVLVALFKQGVPKDAIEAMIKRVGSRKWYKREDYVRVGPLQQPVDFVS